MLLLLPHTEEDLPVMVTPRTAVLPMTTAIMRSMSLATMRATVTMVLEFTILVTQI